MAVSAAWMATRFANSLAALTAAAPAGFSPSRASVAAASCSRGSSGRGRCLDLGKAEARTLREPRRISLRAALQFVPETVPDSRCNPHGGRREADLEDAIGVKPGAGTRISGPEPIGSGEREILNDQVVTGAGPHAHRVPAFPDADAGLARLLAGVP